MQSWNDKRKGSGIAKSKCVSFDGDIPPAEMDLRLARLFSPYLVNGTLTRDIIMDLLVIRDLRMILQTLRICSGSDRSINKLTFSTVLLDYLNTDGFTSKLQTYIEHNEIEYGLEIIHSSKQYPKTDKSLPVPTQITESDDERSSPVESIAELSPDPVISIPPQIDQKITSNTIKNEMAIGLCFEHVNLTTAQRCIKVLKKFNTIIYDLSGKISELERSVSNLVVRISEAESFYASSI